MKMSIWKAQRFGLRMSQGLPARPTTRCASVVSLKWHIAFLTAARVSALAAALLLAASAPRRADAYPGDPDPTFAQRGSFNGGLYAVAVDNWGNIFVGGDFTTAYGHTANYIAVLNSDGSFQAAPQWGGSQVPFRIHALAVDNGGRVYAAGAYGVVRFTQLGTSLWTQDNTYQNPYLNGASGMYNLNSISINELTGDQYVGGWKGIWSVNSGGYTNGMGQLPASLVGKNFTQVRYYPPLFCGTNGAAEGYMLVAGSFGAAVVLPGGQLGAGIFSLPDLGSYPTCAASTPCTYGCGNGDTVFGGTLDVGTSYGPGGEVYGPYGPGIWLGRLNGLNPAPGFQVISSATNSPADQGYGIAVVEALPGGDILIGGFISSLHGYPINNFAHLRADGSVDTAFANHVGFYPCAMAQQPDGKFLVVGVGLYTPVTGQITRRLAMSDPRPVTFTSQPTPTNQTVYPGDPISISAAIDAWPPPSLVWVQNGNELPNHTQSYFSALAAPTSSGNYVLRAKVYCAGNFDSQSARVIVLASPPPPPNDMFSNAFVLSGLGAVASGIIRSATLEPGEPDPSGISSGASVWWTWTAPQTGNAILDVSGSDYAASVNVFTGTNVTSLVLVTNNCDLDCSDGCYCRGLLPAVSFVAVQGTTYQIAIGGRAPVGGLGNIHLTLAEFPINIFPKPWAQTMFGSAAFNAAAFAGGLYLAAGDAGTIALSADGTNWTTVTSPVNSGQSVWGLDYVRGQFIGVADNGTIVTSPDATNWTAQSSGVSSNLTLYSITHGTNNLSVAVGDGGTVVASSDGTNWISQTSGLGTTTSLYSIAFGNGLYAAVGDNGTIITSPDGTNWVTQAFIGTLALEAVTWGNGRFVTVGDTMNAYSIDGTNWMEDFPSTTNQLYGVASGGGYFVAVGQGGSIFTSPDGFNWVADNSGVTNGLNAVAYSGNSQFLVVGVAGITLLHQPLRILPPEALANGIFQFELLGLQGTTVVIEGATSLNPSNWQPIATNRVLNSIVSFSDQATSQPFKFYRAWLQ